MQVWLYERWSQHYDYFFHQLEVFFWLRGGVGQGRATAKISGCWVYTISRRGIVQLGSSLYGSIFLLFPIRVAKTHAHSSQGKSPAPGYW